MKTHPGGWLAMVALVLSILLIPVLPTSSAGLLDDIKQRGAIKLCTADSPYIMKDPTTGNWVGYDAELAQMYATRLGVKLEWVDSSWGNMIPALLAQKCDISWGVWFHTDERAKIVGYTVGVHNTGLLVVVRTNETRFNSYADLNKAGVTFSQLADIGEIEAKKNFPNATIKVIQSDNTNAQSLEVVAGRADANLTDALLAYDLVKKKAGVKIVQGPIIKKSDLAFLVRKENKDLLQSFNSFIADLQGKGTLTAMGQKYGIPPGFR